MPSTKYTILSVGGSIIIPKTGFDVPFLKKFRALIMAEVKKGRRFILTVGGGATCRHYQQALKETIPTTTNTDLDWLGIHTTIFNAEFVRMLFGKLAYPLVVTNPTKKIATAKPIIIAAGWKPGCSTDTDAVLLAKHFGALELINLSNIDYVCDSDPRINPDAKRFEALTWKEYRGIVGDTWTPGMSAPFDPVATRLAERLKLKVHFVKGTDIEQIKKVLHGKKYRGTTLG